MKEEQLPEKENAEEGVPQREKGEEGEVGMCAHAHMLKFYFLVTFAILITFWHSE